MHAVVMESLEEYLSGRLKSPADRNVEAHLSTCQRCREELAGMLDVSELFVSLQTEETLEPVHGFYARVVQQVGKRKAAPSFAGFFEGRYLRRVRDHLHTRFPATARLPRETYRAKGMAGRRRSRRGCSYSRQPPGARARCADQAASTRRHG